MRIPLTIAVAATAMLAASPSRALERRSAPMTDDARSGWSTAASCIIVYYNFCTGWVWIWSGWGPGDVVGVQFDRCCTNGHLSESFEFIYSGAPAGYGYTGTIGVYAADASQCPMGSALASTPWLPIGSMWNMQNWNTPVPASFALVAHLTGIGNPVAFESDHPQAGPTGPPACGTCYPTTRVNHSFYWGTTAQPVCPGSTFNDRRCDAQLLWDVALNCPTPVESSTWGKIKEMYR